jgi:hypothetical protein
VPIELSDDLPTELVPLAWLVGTWAGAGVLGYPTMERDLQVGQEIKFRHDGRPFLEYSCRTWELDDGGERIRPLQGETGYWRVGGPEGSGRALEVLLTHPTGIAEVYVGAVEGPRISLRTDVVARTETAEEHNAATRMYGLVEGDLMWVMEKAALGQAMTPHVSARLKRVVGA